MSQYRSLAVHNSACNDYYYKLQDCQKEHPFRKFFGYCGPQVNEMNKCIKELRVKNRALNLKQAQERREALRAQLREEKQNEEKK